MAIVLKAGKTYTDPYGHTGSDFYGVVDMSSEMCKRSCRGNFALQIFRQSTSIDASESPVFTKKYPILTAKYDEYFGITKLNEVDINLYKQFYSYLMSEVRHPSTFDENGDEVLGELIWTDWESDE